LDQLHGDFRGSGICLFAILINSWDAEMRR
jgi:hypothetical protein